MLRNVGKRLPYRVYKASYTYRKQGFWSPSRSLSLEAVVFGGSGDCPFRVRSSGEKQIQVVAINPETVTLLTEVPVP